MAMGQQLHLPRFATSPTITLVGRSAPPKMMQMLTYLAMKHNTHLLWANTVRAYSFGALYLVERLIYHSHSGRRELKGMVVARASSTCNCLTWG